MNNIKIIFVVLLTVYLMGCDNANNKATLHEIDNEEISVTTVDGCEYILFHGYNKGGIIHKANCKNPIHYYNEPKYIWHIDRFVPDTTNKP